MKAPPNGFVATSEEGERKGVINSELWHACAGPLVSLPPVGSLVVYFPQGHSEQVAASLQKGIDCIPSYPNLPSKLICMLHNVTLHADGETDEVYAQMTLQPVSKYDKEALLASDLGLKQNRQPAEFFCKTLTASDTSTHGGFSVPRRAAEKIFPPLDFSMQPPAQELVARDLHNNAWRFRHIYRGQPKRHLLTTGWSVFVSTKRLFAGDSVLFIRDEKSQLLLGIRHANRQQPALSSSVISSDSMHIGILAAAAHAAANNSPFTIFYNPRASPSEFVIPLAKYNKAMYTQVSLGMRFRMMFETEESGVRRYMGTITAMSDLDPIRWKDSQWRNLQVGWDESTTGERPSRVSIWDIEPVVTPFYICPPPFFRPKFSNSTGMPDDDMPWIGDDFGMRDSSIFPGMSLVQWMSMQHNNQFPAAQSKFISSMVSSASLHNNLSADNPSKLLSFQDPVLAAHTLHLNKANQHNQVSQFQQTSPAWPQQQQLHQTPVNPPQLQTQQQQLPPPSQQQQQPEQQLQQQLLRQQQQNQQQHVLQSTLASNGVASKQTIGQNSQQAVMMPQLQQHHLRNGNMQPQQNIHVSDRNLFQLTSLPQDLQFHHVEQQSGLLQRHQIQQMQLQQPPNQLLQHGFPQRPQAQPQLQQSPEHNLSESQIQLQALQKLQQQQQQSLPPAGPHLQPQLSQQLDNQQHHQLQKLPSHHQQQQQLISSGFSTPSIMQQQLPHVPMTQSQVQHSKAHVSGRVHSALTDGDAPSCSTSTPTDNPQISNSKVQNKEQRRSAIFAGNSMIESSSHFVQEQNKYDAKVKHQPNSSKRIDQLEYRSTITDQLEGSSSATSFCLDTGSLHQNFPLPNLCLEGDQLHTTNNLPFADNIDGLAPDTLLSRAFDSGKDFQNLLSSYGGTPRDIETELSTAEISSQSFGVPDASFKPGCSNDVAVNETGVLGGDLWANQTQRMRTYTKVQKRGSVGRCIDVTHYRGYDDLRHELARMFGIEGQLEDPQRTEWKLVYVDHENDILLVGDDPWEEFVSCVQSIKILSSSEVQQMSLEDELGQVPVSNQACSGTDSGTAWR